MASFNNSMVLWVSNKPQTSRTIPYRQRSLCLLDCRIKTSEESIHKAMGSYPDFPEDLHAYQKVMNEPSVRWRELYEAALLELDREKLLRSIELAEQAIRERAKAAERIHFGAEELQAMNDALHALNLLRRSALRE
jgi:hypothetical protein